MRSVWWWFGGAPALCLAVALPPRAPVQHTEVKQDIKPAILKLDALNAQATFNVPCSGCLGRPEHDESLIFDFQAFSSEQPCGDANITLNGFPLTQQRHGARASGEGLFSAVFGPNLNETDTEHDLSLSWESSCLFDPVPEDGANSHGEEVAQVLTVNVRRIDGRPLENPSGFTISFKNIPQAELLRLAPVPDSTAADPESTEDWRNPPTHLRLTSQDLEGIRKEEENPIHEGPSIEQQIENLRLLQAQSAELDRLIQEKKQQIRAHLRQEATTLKEEIKQCDSLACIVRAVANKAHGAVRVIYLRFRPGHPPHLHPHPHGPGMMDPAPSHQPSWRSQQYTALSGDDDDDLPPARPHGTHAQPAHAAPSPSSPNPSLIGLGFIGSLFCCGCLFSLLNRCCVSLRRRTDRLARREERRNSRLYARCARRQAWRAWWANLRNRNRDCGCQGDYEEKRALILEQEGRLEEAMQEEIRQLREAHEVVSSIVGAEEGHGNSRAGPSGTTAIRGGGQGQGQGGMYAPQPQQPQPQQRLARTNSLPSYSSDAESVNTDPPAYETEEESEDEAGFVADGFRAYTPSTTVFTPSSTAARGYTPGSSVLDGSPRHSVDTLRTGVSSWDLGC